MQTKPTNHIALPYVIFVYATVLLFFVGSLFAVFFNPQMRIILSEFLIVCTSTFVARLAVEQTFITTLLPPLIPKAKTIFARLSLHAAGLTRKSFLIILVTVPLLAAFTNLLSGLIAQLPIMHDAVANYAHNTSTILPLNHLFNYLLGAFAIVVAAPVSEEYLFRGTLLPLLREGHPRLPLPWILGINALLFSIIHFNSFGFLPLGIVGYYFADITTRSRSIMVPITAHAIYNFCNGILFPYILRIYLPPEEMISSEVLAPAAFGAVEWMVLSVSGVGLYCCWRMLHRQQPVEAFYLPQP